MHCPVVSVSEARMQRRSRTWDCSSETDVTSCRKVFPDNVELGVRRNLSLTRLKPKLGMEMALWSAACNLCCPSFSEAMLLEGGTSMMACSSMDSLVDVTSSADRSGELFSVVVEKRGKRV